MSYVDKTININRIYVDTDNPRHDPIENEADVFDYLLSNEKVKQLAKHIVDAGSTSPLERIGVFPHPKIKDAYIAVEGNRRICALKLLNDPDRASKEKDRKYFRNLSEKIDRKIEEINVVVFENKSSARQWVSLRHEGEQDGAGTRPWNTDQIARFNLYGKNKKGPNSQAFLLKEYARNEKLLENNEVERISITTLTRFLSNPVIREKFGLVNNKDLTINVPKEEFNRIVLRFLKDASENKNGVSSRTNVEERKEYVRKLGEEGILPTTRLSESFDVAGLKTETKKTKQERNNKSPDSRKTIIPSSFVAKISNPTLKRLYDELRTLKAEDFPFSATYLFRAVLEQIVILFMKKNGKTPEGKLHKNLLACENILKTQGMTEQELKLLRVVGNNKEHEWSPETIGHFVHGGAIPTRGNIIKAWDSFEPIIKKMLDQL